MIEVVRNKFTHFLFSFRPIVIFIFLLATVFLGIKATKLKIDAGFEKQLPMKHPYIQTFMEFREEFGGANRIIISVSPDKGTIFTPEFLKVFKSVHDSSFEITGVNPASVQSIFSPSVRFVEIVDGGFAGGKVVPADFAYSIEDVEQVRQNLLKSSVIGRLVANNFSAAAISLRLSEVNPETKQKTNYFEVSNSLENLRNKFEKLGIRISIIGFAKAVGDVGAGAKGVLQFLALSILLIAFLVYCFIKSWRFTLTLILCSMVAVVWNLGMLVVLGQGLDPMSILVPFLICAIGVSHGIQIINGINFSLHHGEKCFHACKSAFRRLFVPGVVALFSDTIGFITIHLIEIRIIQELAIIASVGVLGLILTNLILLPILLSYCSISDVHIEKLNQTYAARKKLWDSLSIFTKQPAVTVTLVVTALLFAAGWKVSQGLKIGDLHAGVPELRPDSRYNQDTRFIVEKYSIGVDILNVIVQVKKDGCIDHRIMKTIDDFQWYVSNNPNVQSAVSLPYVAKIIGAGWNEGHPKWRTLSRNQQNLVQAISSIETSTGLLNAECSLMPVMIFSKDHKAESINSIINTIDEFIEQNPQDDIRFRLATGNVGVMAATNDTVADAQFKILLYIYACVIVLCLTLFRSIRATLSVILPLTLVSILAYAMMAILQIGLKTSTLPVAAFGVGIGVDYGIYIFSQLNNYLREGEGLCAAYIKTLEANGTAVLVTGLTLSLSVITWIFSDLQFQIDMGILFAFMLLLNMVGAICVVPALAWLMYPENRH